MGRLITYKDDSSHCFCQIKFENKERILISMASHPNPSVKILKLLLGFIPIKTIWAYDSIMAGGIDPYTNKLWDLFYEEEQGSDIRPLGAIKEKLIKCHSISEVKAILTMPEKKAILKHDPDKSVVYQFADVLERAKDYPIAFPESLLPCDKEVLKAEFKKELLRVIHDDVWAQLLKASYGEIAYFIPDNEAIAANSTFTANLSKNPRDSAKDLLDLSEEELEASPIFLKAELTKKAILLGVEIREFFNKAKEHR